MAFLNNGSGRKEWGACSPCERERVANEAIGLLAVGSLRNFHVEYSQPQSICNSAETQQNRRFCFPIPCAARETTPSSSKLPGTYSKVTRQEGLAEPDQPAHTSRCMRDVAFRSDAYASSVSCGNRSTRAPSTISSALSSASTSSPMSLSIRMIVSAFPAPSRRPSDTFAMLIL
jgi:hypothetical protein